MVAKGPASTLVISKTLTPSRGLVVAGGVVGEDEKALFVSSRARDLILAPQLQKEDRHCCRACQGRRVQGCLAEQVAVFGGEVGFTGSAVHGGLCTLQHRGETGWPVSHSCKIYEVLVQDTKQTYMRKFLRKYMQCKNTANCCANIYGKICGAKNTTPFPFPFPSPSPHKHAFGKS